MTGSNRADHTGRGMSALQLHTRQFLFPKSGHTLAECEDVIGINEASRLFAIADGATEAFDARRWATLLAASWVEREPPALNPADFNAWVADQGKTLHNSWTGVPLSWYAEEKARAGSFAAFVGVQIAGESGTAVWRAIALGDSCLVHSRNNSVIEAFPIADHESFNATPVLVPSHPGVQTAALDRAIAASGSLEPGDVIMLLSDAAAAWYLMLAANEPDARAAFDVLSGRASDAEIAALFASERVAGRIKDDDIAVVRIEAA
jgi:hypothetical protein